MGDSSGATYSAASSFDDLPTTKVPASREEYPTAIFGSLTNLHRGGEGARTAGSLTGDTSLGGGDGSSGVDMGALKFRSELLQDGSSEWSLLSDDFVKLPVVTV